MRATLELDGVLDRLGADHVHGNVARAVQAELGRTRADHRPPGPTRCPTT